MKLARSFGVLLPAMALILTVAHQAESCTEIFFSKVSAYQISARNFDFMTGDGHVRFSPAGIDKQSQYAPPSSQPLKWTSRYPSISFNTVLPKSTSPDDGLYYAGVDGINQAGLKVGTYFLESSNFAQDGPNTTIDICSLMEYFLDNFKTVDEVLGDLNSGTYRVTSTPTGLLEIKLHFLLHDTSGATAVVEFLDGKTTVILNPEVQVLTNSTYEESLKHLKLFVGFGGDQTIPGANESLDRFVRGAFYLGHLELPDDVALAMKYGFAVVQTVSVSPKISYLETQWSIVSDINNQHVYFRTLINPNVANIDLNRLAKDGKAPSQIDLLRTDLSGDITGLFIGKTP